MLQRFNLLAARYQAVLLLVLLGLSVLFAYSNTLNVPFLFDDPASLSAMEWLYKESSGAVVRYFGEARALGYLSFKLNYDLHGFDVVGFHVVNTAIHVINVGLVFAFCAVVFGSRRIDESSEDFVFSSGLFFAFVAALVFALHPLQTQAVTYTVQRLASLTALWYLASLLCYFLARRSTRKVSILASILGCVAFAVAAFYTKQNSATLPLAILLVEVILIQRWRMSLTLALAAVGAFALLVSAVLVFLPSWPWLDAVLTETRDFSRLQYFETQLGVLLVYLKLWVIPVSQQVEYIYPLADGVFYDSFGYVALHLGLLNAAFYAIGRLPWFAFGILFFYLAHTVESGFVPISDLVFEHRMYLPMFGLSIAAAGAISRLPRIWGMYASLALLVVLATVTYQRNSLWADPVELMSNELRINPNKPRVQSFLGQLYREEGRYEEAAQHFGEAFRIVGASGSLDNQAHEQRFAYLNNYIANLRRSGQIQLGIDVATEYLDEVRSSEEQWAVTNNLGYLYYDAGDYNQCLMHMLTSIGLTSNRHESFVGAGLCFYYLDRKEEARMMFINGLALSPEPDSIRATMEQLGLLD